MSAQIPWSHNLEPYIFDFIPFKEDMVERDIEQANVSSQRKLMDKKNPRRRSAFIMKKKYWKFILDIAIVFCILGSLSNLDIIFHHWIMNQMMYIGVFLLSLCPINYHKLK